MRLSGPGRQVYFFDPGVDWVAHERPGVRRVLVMLKSSCTQPRRRFIMHLTKGTLFVTFFRLIQ